MATSEQARHHMFNTLQRLLGEEDAATMIDHLPHGGWSQMATKADLAPLATKAELAELKAELVGLSSTIKADMAVAMSDQTRTMLRWMVSTMAALAALVLGTAQLG